MSKMILFLWTLASLATDSSAFQGPTATAASKRRRALVPLSQVHCKGASDSPKSQRSCAPPDRSTLRLRKRGTQSVDERDESSTLSPSIIVDPKAGPYRLSRRRRDVVQRLVGSLLVSPGALLLPPAPKAFASGGATAGRYTTIPIAKRRYYGRVQQAVHDFLLLNRDVLEGDVASERVRTFFDPSGVVVVPAKRADISGQCTKKDGDCAGKEVRDSRYNDMKASMYLLANAFRTDQQKPPDRLPTVKAAKAFFREMNELEKIVKAGGSKAGGDEAAARYAAALDILDQYLDLVELPPTGSGHYAQEFDTLVGETARIT